MINTFQRIFIYLFFIFYVETTVSELTMLSVRRATQVKLDDVMAQSSGKLNLVL
jgi:hypothetical protein